MIKFAAAGLAIGLMFTSATSSDAFAATGGQTCFVELQRLCPNQTGSALKQCRNANRANFSAACKQSLAAANMTLKDVKPERR
ncbi:MAG: hypothetical protein QOJ54_905 [Aliidongia sp.]|jgi:Skp family chaperone for outer membrane proteins|nr:hypothetical protein [Aliidongia sp.]